MSFCQGIDQHNIHPGSHTGKMWLRRLSWHRSGTCGKAHHNRRQTERYIARSLAHRLRASVTTSLQARLA
jgi:hypothetical protein